MSHHNEANRARARVVAALGAIIALVAVVTAPVPAAAGHDKPPEVVVKFEPGADVDGLLDDIGARIVRPLVPSRGLIVVEDDGRGKRRDAKKLAKALEKASGVEWAEPEHGRRGVDDDRFHAWPEGDPADSGTDPSAWTDQPTVDLFRLDEVHRLSTGEGVTVAMLDTGIDLDHPSLVGQLAPSGHYDYVDDDDVPDEETNGVDDDDDGAIDEAYGHGTHTAGLVALIAPDAELLVYRVLNSDGYGHPHVVAQAINDAVEAGADVINVSFGMTKPKSKVLKGAFKNAARNNVSIVAAVGNDGEKLKRYPAEEKEVIGVAAMGRGNDELADFSNHGSPALVAAPGESVVSTLPDGRFGAWSGTSMATPIVAGQVALVRSVRPDLKPKKVMEILGRSARKLPGKRKVEKGLIDILGSVEDS